MRLSVAKIQAVLACLCAAGLAGCGWGGATTSALPGAPPNGGASTLAAQRGILALGPASPDVVDKVAYNFAGYPDGAWPEAALLDVNGTFYGTTYSGGKNNAGTLFSITPAGVETIIHSFGPYTGPDGAYPEGNVIDVGGTLYGTTFSGGASDYGSVYSFVIATGVEKVIYSFLGADKGDGEDPLGGLVNIDGVLYGTSGGGNFNNGTVYSVTKAGTETILHTFTGTTDGGSPEAGLLKMGGVLYGTTGYGGTNSVGTVFSITTGGTKSVIYNFQSGNGDGSYPYAGLINVGGTLYGTTEGGGLGHGTVFSVTTSGSEKVVYSFAGGATDGAVPVAGLLNVDGTLYGTTSEGGSGSIGDGTVFKFTMATGKEKVIHFFTGATTDGDFPLAGLIEYNNKLYGSTKLGGLESDGVIFSMNQ